MPTPSARDAMVEAAERLVAERGLAAATLREVQTAAGQRNKSAAQYHFGDRDGLLSAVIERRMTPVNADRLARLAALDDLGLGTDLARLVEVYVHPLAVTTTRPGSTYARFLAQAVLDPGTRVLVNEHLRAESSRRVLDRMGQCLDDVPVALREPRLARFVLMLVTTLATWETEPPRRISIATAVADLVATSFAMLTAPNPTRAATTALAANR